MKVHTLLTQASPSTDASKPPRNRRPFEALELAIKCSIAVVVICLLCVVSSRNLYAQAQTDTGALTGTVSDPTGAVIPEATVTITNSATGIVTKGITTSTGQYVFSSVAPGTYTLEVTKTGFGTYSASGIVVHIQQVPTVNVVLKPGSTTQTVTVSAATPLLQAQSAELNQTITGQEVNDLPLSSRDWTTLGQLSAGVTTTAGGTTSSSYYNVNGQSFNQNDFRLNGIDDNVEMFPSSVHGTNAAILPPPDAIQEFALQSGDFSAEFGHSLGGIVNAAVKSGTNQIHGDLWEYVRNDAFNANDYFSNHNHKPKGEYRQNQFGGTIGGPIVIPRIYDGHNKTFFFFDYQGTRIITPSNSFSTVPTSGMVSSNFTNLQDLIAYNTGTRTDGLGRTFPLGTVFDPATTRTVAAGAVDPVSGFQNTTSSSASVRDPFFTGGSVAGIKDFATRSSQLNMLPASRLDQNAIALLKLYPAPTATGFSNNYFQSARGSVNRNQFDIRGDDKINDRDTVFVVYSWYHSNTFTPNPLPGIADGAGLFGFAGVVSYPIWEISGGYTHVFTPTLVNAFHIGFNHAYQNQNSNEANSTGLPEKYGIAGVLQAPGNGGLPNITLNGLTSLGVSGYTPTYHTLKALQLNDSVSWSRGAHTLKAGFEGIDIGGTAMQPVVSRGSLTFNGQYSSIPNKNAGVTGISDMLVLPGPSTVSGPDDIGGPSSYQASNFSLMDYQRWYLAGFAQDDWHVTPRLTLNLGVRWDYFGPQADANGKYANAVFNNGNGPGGTFYLPTKTCSYPRSATFDQLLAKDNINIKCVGNDLQTAQHDNFSPRIGFADQVTPGFVVRGGYGIAYSSLSPRGTGQQLGQNYPFEYTLGFSNTNPIAPLLLSSGAPATLETAIGSLNIQDPSNVSGAGASLFGSQYKFQTPYTETANLVFQYAVTRNSTVSGGYVGEFGRHLQVENVHNSPSQIVPPGASIRAYIPAPDFSPNSIYQTTNGSSSYNSLQTVYQLRMHTGDSILTNYTYSKCMQDANQFQDGVGYRAPWLPGFGIRGDNELCSQDATHVVHASGTVNLPFGYGRKWLSGTNRMVNEVLGGWVTNFIYTYQSGQPFTIGCPISTASFFGCNANKVPGQSMYAGPHNQNQWLNPNAFSNPPVATHIGASSVVLGGEGQQARGPGYSNLDASVFKQFQLHESWSLQIRAEAFNAFNSPQFSNPGHLDFTNKSNFSQITGLRGNARLLQLAGKLFF
ncbi:MAG TPA: carboxypeptidase regulatory-like domain-containing protein [Acidobacteriaceae bacterium]|nr:carboxypeptidase regulatory-like domain-containing protein [Acidobacteriaceae bacterium]